MRQRVQRDTLLLSVSAAILRARGLPAWSRLQRRVRPVLQLAPGNGDDRDAAVLFKESKRRTERQSNRMLENKRGNRN